MVKKLFLSIIIVCVSISSCDRFSSDANNDITLSVDSFATAYFNYNFSNARNYVTPESVKWLRFAASNVLNEDVELLHQQSEGAKHEVSSVDITSDTSAVVMCKVMNYLRRDTLGRAGRMVKSDVYSINLVLRDKRWLVDAGSLNVLRH